MFYGTECWAFKNQNDNKVIVRRWECCIVCSKTRSDKIINENIVEIVGGKPIEVITVVDVFVFLFIFIFGSIILYWRQREILNNSYQQSHYVIIWSLTYLGVLLFVFWKRYQWFFSITRIRPRVNLKPLSFYISFGCTYKTHPTTSTEMDAFWRWCSLNWSVERWIEWDVRDLETSLRSLWLSSE